MALEVLVDKLPTSFAIAVDNPILFDGSKDQDTLCLIALEFAVRESTMEKRALQFNPSEECCHRCLTKHA